VRGSEAEVIGKAAASTITARNAEHSQKKI